MYNQSTKNMTRMQRLFNFLKILFFFSLGAVITAIVLSSLLYLGFSYAYKDKVYPGVRVFGVDVSGKTPDQISKQIVFNYPVDLDTVTVSVNHPKASITVTGKDLNLHLDTGLMAKRAFSIGRQTPNPYHNFLQILDAWNGHINLPLEVSMAGESFDKMLGDVAGKIEKQPIDAVYQYSPGAGPDGKGRVIAFRNSEDGIKIDREKLRLMIVDFAKTSTPLTHWSFNIPTNIAAPAIINTTADNLGIRSLIGRGESYFFDSIPTRVYNINLATSKVSGSLIAPNSTFSFDQSIGTVSAIFGYQKAYVIKEGKTVLDDGGGVCQVSTTLYRAILNAGLPVLERTAHSYRVGFYEQGGFLPGLDATVYPPSPDLKFKNDTGGWLLIQTNFDEANKKLTFDIFGTNDGRKTKIDGPFIISTTPPPDPIYQDDPTLPVGQVKQVDTAHSGANVYFKRRVVRGNEILIDETVRSDFIPWPARFLRGTKTN